MKYTPIPPIGMFDVVEDFDTAFVLAQLWPHETYRQFYTRQSWDLVIIDNGLYEGAEVKWETLDKIGREIEGDRIFVITPEVMHDWQGTVYLTKEFAKMTTGQPYELMVVLQGDMPVVLPKFVEQLWDTVDAFAIPIWMYRQGWERAAVLEYATQDVPRDDKYWHALGLDCLLELPLLRKAGVKSVDCSMPFTAAVHGIDLEVNLILKGKKRVNLLREAFTEQEKNLARRNVETLMKWCRR